MINTKNIKKLLGISIFLVSSLPIFTNTLSPSELMSDSAVLMDASTGQVLFEKNMNHKEYPASTTKIMTGLLALEKGNLDDILTLTPKAVFIKERNSSSIALDVGEQISLRNALYAMAIRSANDAANGVAEHIGGTYENFVNMMNQRAKELGAKNTHFLNSNGLFDENHYSTAYDMALILRQGIKTPGFLEFFNKKTYTIPPTNLKNEERVLYNANSILMGRYGDVGLIASKTGYTVKAQHTLVTAAKRGDRTLVAVVLNSDKPKDKYYDTKKLFEYGFDNFNEVTITNEMLEKVLENEEGKEAALKILKSNLINTKFLLHKDLTLNDIDIKFLGIKNNSDNFSLEVNTHSNLMYNNMGQIIVEEKKEVNNNSSFTIFSSKRHFDMELFLKILIGIVMVAVLGVSLRTIHKIVKD